MKPEEFPGLAYMRADSDIMREKARVLEHEIFASVGYEVSDAEVREYEAYPAAFYVAISYGEEVVGVVRKILPGPNGLPTVRSLQLDMTNLTLQAAMKRPDMCEDLAATTLKKGFRARHNFACVLNLWRLAFRDAIRDGIRHWFAAVDPMVLLHYRNVFHIAFEELGPPQEFLGASCVPCVLELGSVLPKIAVHDRELAAWLDDGLTGERRDGSLYIPRSTITRR